MNSFGVRDAVKHITAVKNGSIFIGKKISSKILEKVRSHSAFEFKKKSPFYTWRKKKQVLLFKGQCFPGH